MTETAATSIDSPEQSLDDHLSAGPPLRGDVNSFPSHGELARTLMARSSIASLSTLTESGHPYASIAAYTLAGDGSPQVCISLLAEHTQNLRRDPRASVLVSASTEPDDDPLAQERVTLTGSFVPIIPTDDDVASYLAAHPGAEAYVDFDDFGWWRLETANVRYIGGFGFMGWATGAEYADASPDPVIPHAAAAIEHMNDDHADSCVAIVRQLAGCRDAAAATLTAIDRYGLTFDAHGASSHFLAVARVSFSAPLIAPDEIRAATVELARRAAA